MKKSMKIVSILMMAIMMVMIATPVFADVNPGTAIGQINPTYDGNKDFTTKVSRIIGFLQWAGAIIGVLIIVILGIKYMMGSLEEKADYKKSMVPFVVGAIVIFAAPQIAKLIFTILT